MPTSAPHQPVASDTNASNPFLAGLPPAAPHTASMGPPPPPPPTHWPVTPVGRFSFGLVCVWLVVTSLRMTLRIGRHIRAYRRRKAQAQAEGAYVVMIPSINTINKE